MRNGTERRNRYADPWERSMTQTDDEIQFEVDVHFAGYSLEAIDNFIAGGEGVPIFPDVADQLREIRHDAFQASKAKNYDLMVAHIRALHFACHYYGARPSANIGEKTRKTQSKRRLNKPAVDSYLDASRNDRIRKFHARLAFVGEIGATEQTAAEFDLTARQIRNILNAGRK